jgi:hypothetical protein
MFSNTQVSLGSAEAMKTWSSLMICCHDDESTTNRISSTIGPMSTWDTWKSLPTHIGRILDAAVPIGTDFGPWSGMLWGWKGKFRNFSKMIITRNSVPQPIPPRFGQWNIWITSLWSELSNSNPVVWIGQVVVELLKLLQQTREHDKIVSKDDHKKCCIFINTGRILMIHTRNALKGVDLSSAETAD